MKQLPQARKLTVLMPQKQTLGIPAPINFQLLGLHCNSTYLVPNYVDGCLVAEFISKKRVQFQFYKGSYYPKKFQV